MLSDGYVLDTLYDAEDKVSDAIGLLDELTQEEFENEETYDSIYNKVVELGQDLYNLQSEFRKVRMRVRNTRVLDSEINLSRVKSYVYDWIDAFLNNDDEETKMWEVKFRKIQNDPRLLNKVAEKLKTKMLEAHLSFEFDDISLVSELVYKILRRGVL